MGIRSQPRRRHAGGRTSGEVAKVTDCQTLIAHARMSGGARALISFVALQDFTRRLLEVARAAEAGVELFKKE